MTCEQSRWQLNALADGALPPFQAWQVRRHLAQCAACAADFTQIVQLSTDARAWRDSAPPAALAARIASALPPQTARLENTAMILERPLPIADPPHRFRTRKVRVALALGVCLASVLTLALWPNKQTNLPAAYADTVLAMQRVHSAAWTETSTNYNPDGRVALHFTRQYWVRRDPPAIATVVPPDPTMHSGDASSQTLENAHGSWSRNLDSGEIQTRPLRTPIAEEVQASLDNQTLLSTPKTNPLGIFGASAKFTYTSRKQELVTLEGQVLLRFRQEITTTFPIQPHRFLQGTVNLRATLWVDARTHRVQRREEQLSSSRGGGYYSVLNNFKYDQPAPPGVFDEAAFHAASHINAENTPTAQGTGSHTTAIKP